jgi:signal transduction histidine kinase
LAQRCLEVIDRNSDELLQLVDDLLILSRVDAGNLSGPDRRVSVPEVVSSAVSILRPSLQEAGMSLSVRLDDAIPMVSGNPGQLERVVMNLLSNAAKFSPVDTPGQIEVSVSSQDGSVNVAIRDHGIGIAAQDREQLFNRFFRADGVRDRGIPGTGLGLAVVKGIVDRHGGTVSVTSTPKLGTTMVVKLPAMA